MLTTFEPILQFLKPHISKSKACFEKFVKKSFRWHLETWQNEIVSIFKLNIKKYREMKLILPGGGVQVALLPGGWGSGMVQKCFCHLTQFFDIQFKNTSNFILRSFKMQSERFFSQIFQNRF